MRATFNHTTTSSIELDNLPSFVEEPTLISSSAGIEIGVFKIAFVQLQARLKYYALSFVPNEPVEDIVSEVFHNWWKSGKSFDSLDHVRGYLFLAVKHQCFKWLEKQKREIALVNYLSQITEDEDYNVKEAVFQRIEMEISKLPAYRQRIFKLAYFEQLSEKQIAALLHISPNTVRNQKARALQTLRLALRLLILFIFI